jgi:outer membrane protein assembly factor BamB
MSDEAEATAAPAELIAEHAIDAARVNGVTFDGVHVWVATGQALRAIDPGSGVEARALAVACDAGTAYDGHFLYQLSAGRIAKLDPATGEVVATIPAPTPTASTGLAWAEGTLWVGQLGGQIHQIDPATGAILRTIMTDRHVTGVTWVDGELWHGTWDDGASELRRLDPHSGAVRARLAMPPGVKVSGLESDGRDRLFCGGGPSGKLRVVRRPRRA